MSAKFDDGKLQGLARSYWSTQHTADRPKDIEKLLAKEALSNEERNQLVNFLYSSKYARPSMRQMREEILKAVGATDYKAYSVSGALARDEMELVYKFLQSKVGIKA